MKNLIAQLVVALYFASTVFAGAVPESARTGLELTVYQGGFALVTDTRKATVSESPETLQFAGISRQIDPATVILWTPEGSPLTLVGQSFSQPTLTHTELLRAFEGKKVQIVRIHPTTGAEIVEEATLLNGQDGIVLRVGDRIETEVAGRIVFPGIPEGLQKEPSLNFTVRGEKGARPLAVSYLTGGFSWSAEYVVTLAEDEKTAAVTAFANLRNETGMTFAPSTLRFIAGQVNRQQAVEQYAPRMAPAEAKMAVMEADVARAVPAGDVHAYDIAGNVTVGRDAQQFALVQASAVPVEKQYVLQRQPMIYQAARDEERYHPEVRLEFKNDAANGLGKPLPAGNARVYSRAGGRMTFLGEQPIESAAAGRKVELSPGTAFDITATRKQTDFKRIAPMERRDDRPMTLEAAFSIEIENAKGEAATVLVEEMIPGDWTITEESFEHAKITSQTARWKLKIPAKGKRTLTYRVRIRQ